MSRPTTRVRVLTVEEFETRAVPALLGLSLPSLALPELGGLVRTVENVVSGLIGSVIPSDPAPLPGGGVTPPMIPTLPTLPTTPDVEVPEVGPVTPPVGSGEPVAGPDVFTPTLPALTTPATTTPPADAPQATSGVPVPTSSTAAAGTISFAPEDDTLTVAFPPTTPVGIVAGDSVEVAPSATSAPASASGLFVNEATPPAAILAGPAALMGVPVDPATVAVTPTEAVPLGIELGSVSPAAVTPPVAAALAAVPDAVVAVAASAGEPEAIDIASWGWSALVAAVAVGGYWVARRYQLVRKVAEVLFPAKLAVPV